MKLKRIIYILLGLAVVLAVIPIVNASGTNGVFSSASIMAGKEGQTLDISNTQSSNSILPLTLTNFYYGSSIGYNINTRVFQYSSREYTSPPVYASMKIQSFLEKQNGVELGWPFRKHHCILFMTLNYQLPQHITQHQPAMQHIEPMESIIVGVFPIINSLYLIVMKEPLQLKR